MKCPRCQQENRSGRSSAKESSLLAPLDADSAVLIFLQERGVRARRPVDQSPGGTALRLLFPLAAPEQPQLDGIRQCLITQVIWVPVVPTVVDWSDPARESRIT